MLLFGYVLAIGVVVYLWRLLGFVGVVLMFFHISSLF